MKVTVGGKGTLTVLAIGDMHCGHKAGLTPPSWQTRPAWQKEQMQMWEVFTRGVDLARLPTGKIDVLLINGDAIDGNGFRTGGTEQQEVDWDRMCEMAVDVINYINADVIYMTFGTPSHVSNHGSQEEAKIASAVGAKIDGQIWVKVNGIIFDAKHKVGSSGIPHGRATSICKEELWNTLAAVEGVQPKADILLRSHVHYHVAVSTPVSLSMTLPALQGPRSKYGVEQCSGIVDFGLVWFTIDAKGNYTWDSHITRTVVKQEIF